MCNIKRLSIIIVTLSLFSPTVNAQMSGMKSVHADSTVARLNSMTVEDYAAIVLPPLDSLYSNALLMSNAVNYFNAEVEYYKSNIKTERRRPLDWIRFVATYNYGNSDLAVVSLMQTTYQVWTQNTSSQTNMFYNVGVALSIPLFDIVNTRNKVKQAQAKVHEMEYRRQSELDVIKQDIIDLYCTIQMDITDLQAASQSLVIAKAQYEIAESDFVNNKITAEVLYRCKSYETSSVHDYERIRKELNKALLTLEVISCTPIISK